jgi:RNA polymerase sigma-70 factor (ECF subfamily)
MPANSGRGSESVDERTLVDAVANHDQDALAECYHRHGGSVIALARRILRDQHRAEEIAQTVFLRLWERPDDFDHTRGSLRSYLLAIAHGRSIDLIRSEEARRRREETDHRRNAPLGPESGQEGWLELLRAEIREAVEDLPEDERDAIVMAYFGGFTYQQVATRLGAPEGTVKSRIRAGLRRLSATVPLEGETS